MGVGEGRGIMSVLLYIGGKHVEQKLNHDVLHTVVSHPSATGRASP